MGFSGEWYPLQEGESREEEDDFPGNWAEVNVLLAHMGKGAVTICHVAKILQG